MINEAESQCSVSGLGKALGSTHRRLGRGMLNPSLSLTSTTMPFGLAISTERAKALEVFAYFWVQSEPYMLTCPYRSPFKMS
jgi:hypothetical protein